MTGIMLGHAVTVLGGCLVGEAGLRTGHGPGRWLGLGTAHPAIRWGAAFLTGWALLGAALFGVAAVALFKPPVIAVIALALAWAGCRSPRPVLPRFLGFLGGIGPAGWLVFGAAAASAGIRLLSPEFDHDAQVYHLGFPAQCLATGRIPLEDVACPFLTPLPVDLAGALPLMLRDDRLARWPAAWAVLAAASVWVGRSLAAGRRFAGWAGPALVIGCAHPIWLAASAKNDGTAAATLVSGLILVAGGRVTVGLVLAGCGAAGKFVYWPIVLAALAVLPGARRRPLVGLMLLLLPSLPWWIRTWVAVANPLYPFGWQWMPTPWWDVRNQDAFLLHQSVFWAKDTLSPVETMWSWPRHLAGIYLPLALAMPALVMVRSTRWMALAGIAGQMAVLGAGHLSRYMLPSASWLLLLAADQAAIRLGRGTRWMHWAATGLVAGWSLASIARYSVAEHWSNLRRPVPEIRAGGLTTWTEAAVMANRHPKVLLVGEIKTYPLAARVRYGGVSGETPLVWRMVRESDSVDAIRRKYRQLGDPALLYNYVSAEWLHIRYGSFTWDRRMLVLYREFVRRHLVITDRTETSEYTNGGFVLYTARHAVAGPGPKLVWYLPGTEGVFAVPARLMHANRHGESARAFHQLANSLPDVGQPANWAAHTAMMTGDFRRAYALLRPFALEGMMDTLNLPQFGECAVRMGAVAEGEKALRAALVAYPTQRSQVGTILALALVTRAEDLPASRVGEAGALLDEAESELRKTMWNKDPALGATRADVVSLLLGLRGELARRGGNRSMAYRWYLTAASAAATPSLADRWRRKAAAVSDGASPSGVLPQTR